MTFHSQPSQLFQRSNSGGFCICQALLSLVCTSDTICVAHWAPPFRSKWKLNERSHKCPETISCPCNFALHAINAIRLFHALNAHGPPPYRLRNSMSVANCLDTLEDMTQDSCQLVKGCQCPDVRIRKWKICTSISLSPGMTLLQGLAASLQGLSTYQSCTPILIFNSHYLALKSYESHPTRDTSSLLLSHQSVCH